MRFKTIAFSLIVSSTVFILGCDDEDDSTIEGGGRAYLKATFDPPLDSTAGTLYGLGGTASTPFGKYVTLTELTTTEIAVTKGQYFPCSISCFSFSLVSSNCSNVQVEAFLNGSQFEVRTYNMGYPNPSCPDGGMQLFDIIIP